MSNIDQINPDDPAYLIISHKAGSPFTFNLDRGASVFVGSGSNCRLILESPNIQAIHCMIWMDENKRLKVQDWNTGQTVLNNVNLDTEAEFKCGDILMIADYRIIPVLDREFHLGIASELLAQTEGWSESRSSDQPPTAPVVEPVHVTPEENFEYPSLESLEQADNSIDELSASMLQSYAATESAPPVSAPPILATPSDADTTKPAEPMDSPEPQNVPSSAATANEEVAFTGAPDLHESLEPVDVPKDLTPSADPPSPEFAADQSKPSTIQSSGFTYDVDADLNEEQDNGSATEFNENSFAAGGFKEEFSIDVHADISSDEDDETTMLRMELEQLRFEIAERDSQIASLKDQREVETTELLDDQQTLKLVSRLEELLDELKHSDERVGNLEELLRRSDEATQAEQEERRQLESWVGEIEQRISSRESEYEAEIEGLQVRLKRTQEQIQESETQFKKLLQSRASGDQGAQLSDESRELIQACRGQIEDLRAKLEQATEQNTKLQAQVTACGDHGESSETVKQLQDKLVALQVEGSRERAEMARKHAELERIRDELEERLNNAKVIGKSDSRIKAMREHLREIHEQEQIQKEESRKNSLGGRIANLLSRLG
ncbi:MAG: FHA domain-containing protein [Planctomycetota bacterium]